MLENLIGYWGGKPNNALGHAAEQLKEAAVAATAATGNDIASYRQHLAGIRQAIETKINSVQGGLTGPAITAKNQHLDHCINAALNENYRVDNAKVQSGIAYFALALATEDFEGEDTSGTQMGQFRGTWRGGGFS